MDLRRYTPDQHRFFDDLITFLGSICGLAIGLRAHVEGTAGAYEPQHNVILQGRPHVSNREFVFYPHEMMSDLVTNNWPTEVVFEEQGLVSSGESMAVHFRRVKSLHASMIESSFVRYFESLQEEVERRHGSHRRKWPSVWNFGRVVRNAIVHKGRISFENPRAAPVSWKTLTYSPADNGKEVMYQDLTPVEIILLMEEMDSAT